MEKKIRKSINITAPSKKVWDVLQLDQYTSIWYEEFSPGTRAHTDWKEGSKAIFTDNSGSGIIGIITKNKPYESLELEYNGVVDKGKEDYESESAKQMKGSVEKYHLQENAGVTELNVELDMDEKYYDYMSEAWDKALLKIKEISEKQ